MFKIDFLLSNRTIKKVKKANKLKKQVFNNVTSPTFLYKDELSFQKLSVNTNNIYEKIKLLPNFDIIVSVGIGGSYLGLEASYEFLKGIKQPSCELIFAGFNLTSETLTAVFNKINNRKYILNVVSKSGNTLETVITYNILKEKIKKDFPTDWNKRIIITTSSPSGFLHQEATANNYLSFQIPEKLGGRYSVLSEVTFVPLAILGYDIEKILAGAISARATLSSYPNDALDFAFTRYLMHQQHLKTELLASTSPSTYQLTMWYQQLFAESEGKEDKGILPFPIALPRDLHSLGQYVQQGSKNFFEVFLTVNQDSTPVLKDIKEEFLYLDPSKLNYLQQVIVDATIKAHKERDLNIIKINIDKSEEDLGYLFYFLEQTCLYSSIWLEVNPFNQPGVELYKKNILDILSKNKSK